MEFLHYQQLKEQALAACKEEGRPYPEVQDIGPVLLALIGDGVYSLYVRLRLLPVSTQVRIVHTMAAKIVSAKLQAQAMEALAGTFTPEEEIILRRGRNAHSLTPKSATVAEYRTATAFEALLGWLLLQEQYARLDEIMEKSFRLGAENLSSKKKHS
jgi:ribonuclease-3 family protein